MNIKYQPGTWLCIGSPGSAILTEAVLAEAATKQLWDLARAGGSLGQVLQILMHQPGGTTFENLPGFALVFRQEGALHLAVRGRVTIEAKQGGSPSIIDGRGVASWREERLTPVPAELTIVPEGASATGQSLDLVSGMALVGRCQLVFDPLAVDPPATEAALVAPGGHSPKVPIAPLPAWRRYRRSDLGLATAAGQGADPAAAPSQGAEPAAAVDPPSQPSGIDPEAPDPAVPAKENTNTFVWMDATASPGGAEPAATAAAADQDAPKVEQTNYDMLWEDHTRIGGAEHAAVRDEAEQADQAAPAGEPVEDLDHDGLTIIKPPSAPPSGQGGPPPPTSPAGPPPAPGQANQVLGKYCGNCTTGNPPDQADCRACQAPLTGDTVPMARPSLGQVTISTGEVVELDRPLVVGRRPRSKRFSDGSVPHLLTVPSPSQDISRSHLAIELQDWSVLASDLGTTNGTILKRAGLPDRRLAPKEQVLVKDGDTFDLGDGILVTVRSVL